MGNEMPSSVPPKPAVEAPQEVVPEPVQETPQAEVATPVEPSQEVLKGADNIFVGEARKKVEYWDEVIRGYHTNLEEINNAVENKSFPGMFTGKDGGTYNKRESIEGMKKLLEEARKERDKEESKFTSSL